MPKAPQNIRLMLVDDHALLREGLRRKFEDCEGFTVVAEAGSAAELKALLPKADADVVLLDIKLPDASGIDLVPHIKAQAEPPRVIVLTMYDHGRYAANALAAGADGFVIKGSPFHELLDAVRRAHGGGRYVSETVAWQMPEQSAEPIPKVLVNKLSKREFDVLVLVGQGLSMKEVSTRMRISPKTVSSFRARIARKLGLSSNADLGRFALENGLV